MLKKYHSVSDGKWDYRIVLSGLILLLILVGGSFQSGNAKSSAPPGHEKIGPGVLETIQKEGEAQVVIALKTTPAMAAAKRNIPRLKNEVAEVQSQVLASLTRSEFRGKHRYETVPGLAGTLRSEAGLLKLASNPNVIKIDLDVGGTGTLGTSVPQIGADARHALGNTGGGVVVAFLDSGLDTDHPDLGDDLNQEACFGDNDGSIDGNGFCPNGSDRQFGAGAAEDDAGHGSHTTGIVTSGGVVGSLGVAPDANIVAIKVLDNCNFSGCFYRFSEIVAALDYINANNATLGVDVINMSIGTSATFPGNCDTSTSYNILGAASINTLRANGVIAFASSGNNGSGTNMTSPACLSNVVSVGAVDTTDTVAGLTNSNAATDIMAPGINILSAAIGGGTLSVSGTSMASPHAAGCAALLIESGEATTPAQIETRLEASTIQVTDATNGLTFPRIDCDANTPPVADAGGPYLVNEGSAVTLDGSGSSDPDNDPIVLFSWDVDNDGTYDYSFTTPVGPTLTYPDGPASYTIILRVEDSHGATDTDSATVIVSNVSPSVNAPLVVPQPSNEGQAVTASASFSDPGIYDAPFTCSVDYGDGSALQPATVSGNTCTGSPHIYAEQGTYAIKVTVIDKDGGAGSNTVSHQVNNVPPAVTVDIPSQTVQYSDGILAVTISATDVLADPMTITSSWNVDGGGFTAGLPTSLALTPIGCIPSGAFETCTWTLSGIVDVPAGTYKVRLSVADDDGAINVVDITLTVETEDAAVSFPLPPNENQIAWEVDGDDGDIDSVSLTVLVKEVYPPDSVKTAGQTPSPGDLTKVSLDINLVPIGPGSTVPGTCSYSVNPDGYGALSIASCTFADVPVNTYIVAVKVVGGYYSGENEDVLVVFDPSLGFTTGGGWFYWPGTDEKTNFGYTMKYNKKGKNVKGSFLLIRHLADGSKYRVKSNALYGLALGDVNGMGWASFSGKATYLQPGWDEPIGNHEFIVYVEDHGEPGKDIDRIWLEMHDRKRDIIPALSMARDAYDNAETISGGNIVVPH